MLRISALLLLLTLFGCTTAGRIRDFNNETDKRYKSGLHAIYEKNYKIATSELSSCLDRNPLHQGCLYEMGWAQIYQWNWADAITTWNTLKRVNPKHENVAWALSKAEAHFKIITEARALKAKAPPRARKSAKRTFLSLRAVGDMMLGSDYPKPNFPPEGVLPLEKIKPLLKDADIRFGNMEGTLCDGGTTDKCSPNGNCYAFRSPTRFGEYFKDAGFDVVSLANNHVADFGDECMLQTRATLDKLGIKWSGPPGTFAQFEKGGKKIALAAFHTALHVNNVNDLPEARKFIHELKMKNDLVIVSFHGGAEGFDALHVLGKKEIFFDEDRGDVLKFAHAMIDAGAALVIGHGPHVTRGMEIYKDHLIIYSLGNFATYGTFNLIGFNSVGLVLDIRLDRKGLFAGGKIIPTRQTGFGIPEPDPRDTSIDLIRYLSVTDFPDSGAGIAQDGSLYTLHRVKKGPRRRGGHPLLRRS